MNQILCILNGLNTWKSNRYWSRSTRGWVSTIQCMYTVWPEQCMPHVNIQYYDTWHLKFSQWYWWEFKSFMLLTLCLWKGSSKHSEGDKNLQNNRNCLHSDTASHSRILKFSLCHQLWAHCDTFLQKWYQFAQEGSTIAQFSNYNVRILEHCTRMWPPAISVIYSQHHEWVYKQPWYIMLKYGFLQEKQRQHLTKRINFLGTVRKKRTDNFWYI
jgi:hypothetical protein